MKEQKEKIDEQETTYNVTYTKSELEARVQQIQQSDNFKLFLQLMDGQKEYDELVKLVEILSKEE